MFFALVWWVVSARHWFKGPRVNLEHMMLADEAMLVGKQISNDGGSGSNSPGVTDSKTVGN